MCEYLRKGGGTVSEKPKKSAFASPNFANVAAITVITLFCVCIVVLLAKTLFASNSSEVPEGLNTATLRNTNTTTTTTTAAVPAATSATVSDQNGLGGGETASVTTTTAASAANSDEMFVSKYVQLLKEPKAGSGNIVCMSPNVKVKVLERRADGYYKVTFKNGDGSTCTGYVMNTFLSPNQVQR